MYDQVLIPTDGSEGTERIVDRALDVAGSDEPHLHLLYVVDVRPYGGLELREEAELEQRAIEGGRRALTEIAERVAETGLEYTRTIETGIPSKSIAAYAEEQEIDLIAMGTHGRTGTELAALGSTTERVLRTVDTPVVTAQLTAASGGAGGRSSAPGGDILVPTDGSEAAARAGEHAIRLAGRWDSTVHAVYVVDTSIFQRQDAPRSILGTLRDGGKNAVAEIERLAADTDVRTTTSVVEGTPYRAILERTTDVDLIALGRRGRTGLPESLLGSTTARVVRLADTPVLSVT